MAQAPTCSLRDLLSARISTLAKERFDESTAVRLGEELVRADYPERDLVRDLADAVEEQVRFTTRNDPLGTSSLFRSVWFWKARKQQVFMFCGQLSKIPPHHQSKPSKPGEQVVYRSKRLLRADPEQRMAEEALHELVQQLDRRIAADEDEAWEVARHHQEEYTDEHGRFVPVFAYHLLVKCSKVFQREGTAKFYCAGYMTRVRS